MYMDDWKSFSQQEISEMGANAKSNPKSNPKPFEDTSERHCSSCGKNSIRNYYREGRYGRGTTWFWCSNCHKYIHFTVAPRSKEYEFNDPIADVPEKVSYKWYEYLDSLWNNGILPQVFKKKKTK